MKLLLNYIYRDKSYLKYKDLIFKFLVRGVERASELS